MIVVQFTPLASSTCNSTKSIHGTHFIRVEIFAVHQMLSLSVRMLLYLQPRNVCGEWGEGGVDSSLPAGIRIGISKEILQFTPDCTVFIGSLSSVRLSFHPPSKNLSLPTPSHLKSTHPYSGLVGIESFVLEYISAKWSAHRLCGRLFSHTLVCVCVYIIPQKLSHCRMLKAVKISVQQQKNNTHNMSPTRQSNLTNA